MRTRLFDLALTIPGMLLAGPLILILAVVLRVLDGAPIFFRQERVGQFGRMFRIWKFRTMRPKPAAEAGSFEPGNQSRVTPIGRFLRKTKLDELPQLFNVLTGEMSLVGPRPEVRQWVDAYPAQWREVLEIRPGITDPAAIVYRDEEELLRNAPDSEAMYRDVILPRKLQIYLDYRRRRTLLTDLKIIAQTFAAILR